MPTATPTSRGFRRQRHGETSVPGTGTRPDTVDCRIVDTAARAARKLVERTLTDTALRAVDYRNDEWAPRNKRCGGDFSWGKRLPPAARPPPAAATRRPPRPGRPQPPP